MALKLAVLALAGVVSVAAASSSPRLVDRIPTGRAPCGSAAGFGSVWVANDGSGTLARINPETNRVVKRIRVGAGACSVAVGAGAVWVTNYKRAAILRVDPRTAQTRLVRVGAEPFDVLIAFGRVWATAWADGTLAQMDPRTLRVVRRLDVGPRPTGLTAAKGAVWVGFGRDATAIARVDPETGAIERVPVGVRAPGWFVRGARDLWITADDNAVLHVHPSTRRVLARLRIGRTLAQGSAAPDGTLWIPDKEQNVVFRVDPRTERVVGSFAAGRGAFDALRAFRTMWVTSYAGRDVWRFRANAD
jgi:streptogramin lyase